MISSSGSGTKIKSSCQSDRTAVNFFSGKSITADCWNNIYQNPEVYRLLALKGKKTQRPIKSQFTFIEILMSSNVNVLHHRLSIESLHCKEQDLVPPWEQIQCNNTQRMTACRLAGWYNQGGFALSSVSSWLSDPPQQSN